MGSEEQINEEKIEALKELKEQLAKDDVQDMDIKDKLKVRVYDEDGNLKKELETEPILKKL